MPQGLRFLTYLPFQFPWFTICVSPKYLENGDEANATMNPLAPASSAGATGGAAAAAAAPSPHGRTVYAELGFLRAGFYEWQVMAVSLAGNGSWTQSHFFDVPEDASRSRKSTAMGKVRAS